MNIRSLTGLRGLAAIWVMTDHFRIYFEELFPSSVVLSPLFQRGYFGVDLFFLLSGFLLTMRYWDSFSAERVNSQRSALLDYGMKRLARIYPVYLFTLIVAILLFSIAILFEYKFNKISPDAINPLSIVLNLLMIQTWFGYPSINGPSWSVSCEFAAYLVLPFRLINFKRLKRKSLICSLLIIEITCALTYVVSVNFYSNAQNFIWIQIATEVTLGSCTYLLIKELKLLVKRKEILLYVCMGTLIISLLIASNIGSDILVRSYIPFILLAIISLCHQAPHGDRGLSSKPMVSLGIYSYSLYLTHGLIWNF